MEQLNHRRRRRALALGLGVVVVLAGCGSDHSGSPAATTATTAATAAMATTTAQAGTAPSASAVASGRGGGHSITIKNFMFEGIPLQVGLGDSVTFTNDDNTNHTATADDKSFDTGRFSSGAKTITPTHLGAITFHCDIHDYMTGVIQVAPA